MATASFAPSDEMSTLVPRTKKSFKASAPLKLTKVNTDVGKKTNSLANLSAFKYDLAHPGRLQEDVKEENNNELSAEDVYNFTDDDGEIDIDDDNSDHSGKQKDERQGDTDGLFLKLPLKAQPHRIQKNLKTMKYKCPYCPFSSLYYSAVSNHTLIHTGEKPYQCHLCNHRARQRAHIIIHMRVHSGQKPFKCMKCSYCTTQRNHLRVHMQTHKQDCFVPVLQKLVHKKKGRKFSCNQCDYTALRKNNLAQHILVHSGAKPFKCDMCPYRSNQKGHLNVHIRTHTREKPYKCRRCPFASTVPKTLRAHITMHQGKRHHKCPNCTFSTNQSFCLKKHVALHVNENESFRCSHCPFTSNLQEDFEKHCTIHTVPSAYVCQTCKFITPFKYQYTTHIMNHARKSKAKANTRGIKHSSPKSNSKDKHSSYNIPSSREENLKKSGKSKLRINTGSLLVASKDHSTSYSTTLESQETSSASKVPKKKPKKAFVCLYCDLNLVSRDEWVAHEMRHFKAWPEII